MDFEGKLADLKENLKAVMTKLKNSDFIDDHTKRVYGINAYTSE